MTDEETPRFENAVSAETFVEERSGRWYVSIAVLFDDGIVRKEINSYRSRREAEIAADHIKRTANMPGLRPAPEFGPRPNIADVPGPRPNIADVPGLRPNIADESEPPTGSDE